MKTHDAATGKTSVVDKDREPRVLGGRLDGPVQLRLQLKSCVGH